MPDSAQSQSPNPPAATPSSPPPSGTATSSPAEYRFANDQSVPEYARGKTAQEVLGIADRMFQAGLGQLTQQRPAQQAQTQNPPPTQTFTLDQDGYVTGAQLAAYQQQAIQQYLPDVQRGIELGASGNLGHVRQKYEKEFAKYGPEILSLLQSVPKGNWTIDNLEKAVKFVRADHFDDYRAEWQTDNAAKMEQTIRSGGAGGAAPVDQKTKSNSLESEKIPAEWKIRAQKAGLTESTVREFCVKNDTTEEAFYKQFDNPMNPIVAEVQDGR